MQQDQDKQEDLKSSFLKIEMLSSGPVVCIVEAGRVDEVIFGQSMLGKSWILIRISERGAYGGELR